jgi:anti-anti-sigma factor
MAITQDPAIRLEVEELVDAVGTRTMVRLHGQLMHQTAEKIKDAVKPLIALGGRIAIDVGDVNYLDSSGLGALVGLKVSACNQGQCRLALENVTPRIREILTITYLTAFFES